MSQALDVRAPLYVRANQPDQQSVLAAYQDPDLLAKRGRLYVLCASDTPLEWLAALYERYYTDASLDIQPVLQRSLAGLCHEHPEARALIPLAVVIEDLDLIAVGTPEGALWLDRFGSARELLPGGREARTLDPQGLSTREEFWLAAQYRLSAGDVLLMTTRAAAQRLLRKGWRGLSGHGSLEHMLRHVVGRVGRDLPVSLIGIPGFAPVADLGPVRHVPGATKSARAPLAPKQRSPIWPALIVALVAVTAVLIIKRPTLSGDTFSRLFDWVLTPPPSSTPAPKGTPPAQTRTVVVRPTATLAPLTPTETPSPSRAEPTAGRGTPSSTPTNVRYPSPELIFPREREELEERTVTLRWSWSGALAEDEWFDVRMWREGMAKSSIAWTKERSYQERYLRPGWYHWTVTVVRVDSRIVVSELCDEPSVVSFLVLEEGEKARTATTMPSPPATVTPTTLTTPTRVTPVIVPTQGASPSRE